MTRKLNDRAKQSMAHWADLRSGGMYRGDDKSSGGTTILVVIGAAFVMVALIAAYAFGGAPAFAPGPGMDICMTARC